jgi:hypothetical protein
MQLCLGVAHADKRSLVETTHDYEVTSKYGEIEQMRQQVLIKLSGMPSRGVTSVTERWVYTVWQIIDDFNELQNLIGSSEPQSHLDALSKAQGMKEHIEDLKSYDVSTVISMLPETALERFLLEEATFLEGVSTQEKQTTKKIIYLNSSSKAFHDGGDISNNARLDYEARELSMKYKEDMKIAEQLCNDAHSYHLETKHVSGFLSEVDAFLKIKKAEKLIAQALEIYSKYNDAKLNEALLLDDDIKIQSSKLVSSVGKVVGVYVALIFALLAYVLHTVLNWSRDLREEALGGELIP